VISLPLTQKRSLDIPLPGHFPIKLSSSTIAAMEGLSNRSFLELNHQLDDIRSIG
jgi:hypothetical protein